MNKKKTGNLLVTVEESLIIRYCTSTTREWFLICFVYKVHVLAATQLWSLLPHPAIIGGQRPGTNF